MTTPGDDTKDFESILQEADQLMEDFQVDDDSPGIIIDGFAIDSDEEEGDEAQDRKESNALIHPLQEGVLSNSETPLLRDTTSSLSSTGQSANNPGVTLDQFKAQTSKFASSFASFAQKAASQVVAAAGATGTVTPPNTYNMSAHATTNSMGNPSFLVPGSTTMSSMNNSNGFNAKHLASPSAPTVSNPHLVPVEYDNETKARLIQDYVGGLLPGERVIMFLSNLLHVSDSTGFSFVANTSNTNTVANPEMWCCVMTYYRLVLFGTNRRPPTALPRSDWNSACWPPTSVTQPYLLEIPLASMERVEKSVYTAGKTSHVTSLMGLVIFGKDNGRLLRFTTPSYADTLRAHDALLTYAFPGRRNLGYLFAFESKRAEVMSNVVMDETGQKKIVLPPTPKRFDGLLEFQRQLGLNAATTTSLPSEFKPWTIWTKINAQYQLCGSYPSILVGPSTLPESSSDAMRMLSQCASFRSEQRLPALTWGNRHDGASLWRSSQPKIGIQGNRSMPDEMILKHIQEAAARANALSATNAPTRQLMEAGHLQLLTGSMDLKDWTVNTEPTAPRCGLKILDLRPRSAAMANRTSGYGYENTSNYPGTTLQFCNINNIHAVRDSYQKLSALCNNPNAVDVQWNALVEDTKWLAQIRVILTAAWEAAFWIQVHRLPVLLHCSHGWDRTSQVAVLAQLLLDPHFRTMRGFATSIEKDFMSFGHPFHTRCAHGEGRGGSERGNVTTTTLSTPTNNNNNNSSSNNNTVADEGQISPIFLQFLDCAYQLVSQYPNCFEFNTQYLLLASEHVYSCRFGNLLCDTERERELLAGIRQRTYSLWDYLEQDELQSLVRNPNFVSADGVLLMPLPTLLRNVTLWTERHCKYGAKPTALPHHSCPAVKLPAAIASSTRALESSGPTINLSTPGDTMENKK